MALSTRFHLLHSRQPRRLIRREGLLIEAFGYSGVTGITFALLRRFRELVWIGLGLLCLALVGGQQQFMKVVPTTQVLVPDPEGSPQNSL